MIKKISIAQVFIAVQAILVADFSLRSPEFDFGLIHGQVHMSETKIIYTHRYEILTSHIRKQLI